MVSEPDNSNDSPPLLCINSDPDTYRIPHVRKHPHGLLEAFRFVTEDVGETTKRVGGEFANPELGRLRADLVCLCEIRRCGGVWGCQVVRAG